MSAAGFADDRTEFMARESSLAAHLLANLALSQAHPACEAAAGLCAPALSWKDGVLGAVALAQVLERMQVAHESGAQDVGGALEEAVAHRVVAPKHEALPVVIVGAHHIVDLRVLARIGGFIGQLNRRARGPAGDEALGLKLACLREP
eukprot:CAMPEP_0170282686 /NCGR_PEP_ID=MMETSP0116_2-20130129/41371_1 /TAXON_ID=400756 /ORGANISM="Durinskia baltica, Strain CSIRO CS-38" /LENGTH=147 /DNA_ID=CAMNT_0010534045 /DNA_START=255 /DNA_END=693 /DNA_ORIENTATION=-